MNEDITTAQRSRRSLLAAGLGAAAAAAVASVSRLNPVRAADASAPPVGSAVPVAGASSGDTTTSFTTTTNDALVATSTSAKGVAGMSTSGQGVHGESSSSAGVGGVSDTGNAVHGESTSSRGVYGQSTSGTGVEGSGVVGVRGESEGGYALETASGRVRFEGISGLAVIEAGKTTLTMQPTVPINGNTIVLLTPQSNIGSKSIWYTYTEGDGSSNGTVVLHLSAKRSNNTQVAYLLLEHA